MRARQRSRRTLGALILVLAALAAAPGTAGAGPPWITVEYPPNPLDPATRDALLVVRTYRHGASVASRVTAVAHGVVGRERRSVRLAVAPTGRPGVYAVRGDLPGGGAWAVRVDMVEGGNEATALVALAGEAGILSVRVPHGVRDGWTIPHPATEADVEEMLRAAQRLARVGNARAALGSQEGDRERGATVLQPRARARIAGIAGLGLAALLPLGAGLALRHGRR